MQDVEMIASKLKQLPDEQQNEVSDFVDFLLSRQPVSLDTARVLRESAGVWKDEVDGITYEDAMRNQWERRR